MLAIIRKEIQTNLGSFGLMLAIAVFFLLVGFWLWFFPDTAIPDNKFATLQTLFELAPWIFLFILPALTMRSIAEEKSTGTLDLLRTKPVSMFEVVSSKFLAVMILILIILLISQIYTYSVYQLGYPVGNLDIGGTLGSYLGWLLLAGCFTAIGIFASAIASSQMIAFLLAAGLCFLFYIGPVFIATLPVFFGTLDYAIQWWSIQSHYQSMSRGVITWSDLCFFAGIMLFFLLAAGLVIQFAGSPKKSAWRTVLSNKGIWLALGFFLAAGFNLFSIDLTEDRRFTLGEETKTLIKSVDDIIYVNVLMDGNFPAAFTRLKKSALEKLKSFNQVNKKIQFTVEDPLDGDPAAVKANQESLKQQGVQATTLTVFNGKEKEQKIIYPYAIFHFGERQMPVNLLESQDPTASEDEILNRSVALLEFKFGNAIQKLRMNKNPVIAFTKGHGELVNIQTADLERTLRPIYSTGRIILDSVIQISKEIDVLVVAKPQKPFSNRDNFLIDQYLMNGGKILWCIDPLYVNTDTVNASNRLKQDFNPLPYDLNLDEIFFKYGWRLQPNIVMDYECTTVPLLMGYSGSTPQFEPKPWYFHPLVAPDGDHPIIHNLDRVGLFYPSTIDTIKTKMPILRTTLLSTSMHSRTQMSPSPVNFEIVRQALTPEQFNRGKQTVGLLLEGKFTSAFENRISAEFNKSLIQIGAEFRNESEPTKMIVFSDGDLIGNAINNRGEPMPLGFNFYEKRTYPANKNLILNCIEYLLDDRGIMQARNKDVKLRLLDEAQLKISGTTWRWINLILPVLTTLFLASIFTFWRKQRYATI